MSQRLHAGTKFNAQHIGIVIQSVQLLVGITAALVAKIGLAGNLVGILGVHHAQVHAHQRHLAQKAAERIGPQYCVARGVEHHADRLKAGLFPDIASCQRTGQQAERTVELDGLRPLYGDGCSVAANGKSCAPVPTHRHPFRRGYHAEFRRKGGQCIAAAGGKLAGKRNFQVHIHLSQF